MSNRDLRNYATEQMRANHSLEDNVPPHESSWDRVVIIRASQVQHATVVDLIVVAAGMQVQTQKRGRKLGFLYICV